jgi:hypothetical protein
VDIGFNNVRNFSNTCISIGSDNNQLERGDNTICMGTSNTFNYGSVCVGDNIKSRYTNSIYIGSGITTKQDTFGSLNTIIGSYDGLNVACTPIGFISVGFGPRADKDGKVLYQIGAHHATDYNKDNYNLEETLTSDYDHKKYIYGIGGYDGTDPVTTKAKSLQEVLDTKANKTDVNSRLDDLQNRCFKFGIDGSIAAPYKGIPTDDSKLKIKTLKDNQEYTYVNVSGILEPGDPAYNCIYDKTLDKTINIITSDDFIPTNKEGDFFKTSESLDLTHTFYLDNEKTGIVDNLTQLTIEETNVFVNFPYVEINDNLNDSEVPQYIYDATDNKWIEVVDTFYTSSYVGFNTEEPLDLTHEFYNNVIGNWTSVGEHSTALGCYAYSGGNESIALGCFTTVNGNGSTCLGYNSQVDGDESIVLGYNSSSKASYNVVLGRKIKSYAGASNSVAIGTGLTVNGNHAIGIGDGIDLNNDRSIAIGDVSYVSVGAIAIGNNNNATGDTSIAIGDTTRSKGNYSTCIGYRANATGLNSSALGAYSSTGGDYAIALGKNMSNTKSIFGVGFNGVNGIDMDRDNYGLYLKGFGGYDGTNLVVPSGNTETLNPGIKSVQQIINEKADASAYYTKTEIDGKGYLTAHQSLDDYAKKTEIPNVSTKADLVDGKLKAEQLPKLDNIAEATTTEDMITKFNDLLADLKAKGYMTADITT